MHSTAANSMNGFMFVSLEAVASEISCLFVVICCCWRNGGIDDRSDNIVLKDR